MMLYYIILFAALASLTLLDNYLILKTNLSICSLFLMHGHSFERICIKFGMWHPYTLQMVMGGEGSEPRWSTRARRAVYTPLQMSSKRHRGKSELACWRCNVSR